ncbi:MAG: IS4 family transposase [Saprospiraceae bacterium]|nr:IS4 family transposase [Saprospiraceae bacterium]
MSVIKVSLFSQVLQLIDRNLFAGIVRKYGTDKHSKGIDSWTHLVAMLFMHLANATSNRDISNGLRSATGNLSHLGVTMAPSKSSMSYINAHRSYKLFEDFYYALLEQYEPSLARRRKYAHRLKRKIFIMDASVIPLSLSLFDWAKFRRHKGAIKLHSVLDYDTGLPSYSVITDGKVHDVKVAQQTVFPSESVLVMDRAYVDFEWLYNLDSTGVFFVTRLKSNVNIEIAQSFLVNDKHEHILSDEDIRLTGFYTSQKYPAKMRIVRVYDEINDKVLIILTNNLSWTADTISQLYKARWDVEVFFKHLKQLFRVKTFIGTSANAVRIQMWTSMIAILLLKFLKQKAIYPWHLSNLVRFLRINLFVKIDLWKWINKPIIPKAKSPPILTLF